MMTTRTAANSTNAKTDEPIMVAPGIERNGFYGRRSETTSVDPRVATMYIVTARAVSGAASSAFHWVPRYSTRAVPSAFHLCTRTAWPRSSDAIDGAAAIRLRQ